MNELKNGKGKKFQLNGCLKFEGDYLDGKKNGQGKEYFEKKIIKWRGI